MTHYGVMAIRIQYGRRVIECSTLEEFRGVVQVLNDEEERLRKLGQTSLQRLVGLLASGGRWDEELFSKFIGRLGEAQTRVLGLLVRRRRMTDEELRSALNLETNQQLAGVLSGISKNAAALNIPARDVYTIDREFQSGEVTKTYLVAESFLRASQEMNWPAE